MTLTPLLKKILPILALTLLAPLAAQATTETWNPGQWALSNGNRTATSPNTGSAVDGTGGANGSINSARGVVALPSSGKTYFEITVGNSSGGAVTSPYYYLECAFAIGVGIDGITWGHGGGNNLFTFGNNPVPNQTAVVFSYNEGGSAQQTSGNVTNACWLTDPEDDAHPTAYPVVNGLQAAPSLWRPGDVIGIGVDRVTNHITFWYKGNNPITTSWHASGSYGNEQLDGSGVVAATTTNTFDISGLAGKTIYPVCTSWWKKGPTATINGGSTAFTYAIPSGYTALDGGVSIPVPPTGVTAAGGSSHVQLNWNATSGATSYHVKRSTTSGSGYATIASPTTNSYNDTTAVNGTTYYYVVSAVNSAGESANSSQVSATPSTGIPSVPTGLTASGGNNVVNLGWSVSSGATSYKVFRSTSSGGPFTTVLASPTTNSYSDTTAVNGTTYYYEVAAVNGSGTSANSSTASATPSAGGALPSGQTDSDIGGSLPAGSGNYNGGVYTLTGGGSDIWGTADQFNYVHQTGAGDVTLITRVTGLSGTSLNANAKAGVQFRDSTVAGSIFVGMDYEPTGGGHVEFIYRSSTGGVANYVPGVNVSVAAPSTTTPVWLKLIKSGTTYTAYYSTSVSTPTWILVNSSTPSVTVSLTDNNNYLTGLEVCSHNSNTALVTGTFDNVSLGASGGALPTGQTDIDIGSPSPAGTASYSGGVYTTTGGGANIFGTSDQYNYVEQTGSGDQTLIARVTGLSGTNLNQYAKAGVEFRDSTAANAIDIKADYEPGTVCFTSRSATGGSAVLNAYVTVSVTPSTTTPVWVKLVKSGTSYAAYYSTSVGTPSTWTQIGSAVTVTLTNSNYLEGLCTCSHNNGTAVTAIYDNVSF